MDYLCIKCEKKLDEETETLGFMDMIDMGYNVGFGGVFCKYCKTRVYELFGLPEKCTHQIKFYQNMLDIYNKVKGKNQTSMEQKGEI